MSDKSAQRLWQRRKFLQLGLGGGICLAGGAIAFNQFKDKSTSKIAVPFMDNMHSKMGMNGFNPMAIAREFDYGKVTQETSAI